MKKKYEAYINAIADDYNSGVSPVMISKKYSISLSTVVDYLKSIGIYKPRSYGASLKRYLAENYESASWEKLCTYTGLNKEQLVQLASKMGFHRSTVAGAKYSIEEDNILKKYAGKLTVKDIQNQFLPHRSVSSIRTRMEYLRLIVCTKWTDSEIDILRQNYEVMPIEQLMSLLPGRTYNAISIKGRQLGFRAYHNNTYTEKEEEFLKENFQQMSDVELSGHLQRSSASIKEKRRLMGLHRIYDKMPSYASIDEYLRKHNAAWKKESAASCKYRCVLSGDKFDEIHHLYGMNLIVRDTLEMLDFDVTRNINEWSETEKSQLLSAFLKIQANHPLGVCLRKDIHKKFHDRFGRGGNTPEQYELFVKQYTA